ncbi:MAG TPA: hypothetical protein DEB40_08205 [Elusimicrobia bacterium]|nr:hypothetical protein [Elusimicrobiota bacterium]HBT61711.1 hypothetical protein [Elusimicrobiota bacterium]
MTRTWLAIALLSSYCPCSSLRAAAAVAEAQLIAWNDPAHIHYFNYQRYLIQAKLYGETEETWNKLNAEERRRKVNEGELFLKEKLKTAMVAAQLDPGSANLLKTVWGEQIDQAIQRVLVARNTGDSAQIDRALAQVHAVSRALAGTAFSWDKVFDGKPPSALVDLKNPDAEDFLAPKKAANFLDSLSAPDIQDALSTQKNFAKFLREKGTPAEAMPGLLAMYSVLSKATGPDREESKHVLPTVVKFLKDEKKIVLEDMEGALGFAVNGDYDKPEKVGITPLVKATDPLIVGKTLAHEFQHIYDMYTGRYYTLDSELRGFKTAVLYLNILKASAPLKYQELLNNDNDATRDIMQDAANYSSAYRQGVEKFAQAVAFGHHYSRWNEGVFFGRLPLKEAVDPTLGAPRELAALKSIRQEMKDSIGKLEKEQESIRGQRERKPSRELDKALEKITKDLYSARSRFNYYDTQVTIKELRVRRMESELAWLAKKARAEGAANGSFDLHLAVDQDYVLP